jgi:hypothetical protein
VNPAILIIGSGLAVASLASSVTSVREGVFAMEGQHWLMLAIVLAAGYVAGRVWATPARMVGLP